MSMDLIGLIVLLIIAAFSALPGLVFIAVLIRRFIADRRSEDAMQGQREDEDRAMWQRINERVELEKHKADSSA